MCGGAQLGVILSAVSIPQCRAERDLLRTKFRAQFERCFQIISAKFCKAVPTVCHLETDRLDAINSSARRLDEREAKPHIHAAEKLVFKPKVDLVVGCEFSKLIERIGYLFVVFDLVVAVFGEDESRALAPEFIESLGVDRAVDVSLAAHDDLAFDACLFEFLNLRVAG